MENASPIASLLEQACHYDELRRTTEALVVRWEWADGPIFHYEPAYFELNDVRPGRRLLGAPARVARKYCYGRDGHDRVRVVRQYVDIPGRFYETFYLDEADGIGSVHFSYEPTKPWINVRWMVRIDDRITQATSVFHEGGEIDDQYLYDTRGKLVEHARTHRGNLTVSDIEHDENGIVRVVRRLGEADPFVVYQRPDTVRDLLSSRVHLCHRLEAAIMDAIRATKIDDEVYALALHTTYADANHLLPPRVSLGLASEREAFVGTYGSDAPEYIWSPYEWATEMSLDLSPADEEAFRRANATIYRHRLERRTYAALRRVAYTLRTRNMPFRVSNDMVCFFAIWDMDDFPSQVTAQMAPHHVEVLRKNRYL